MRSLKDLFVLIGVIACLAPEVMASRFDVVAGRTGGPANGGATCKSCHGQTTGPGMVEIFGAPNHYQADAVYDLVVRVTDPTRLGAGFQISAEDASGNHIGELSVIDSVRTALNTDDPVYLNHSSDGVDDSVANWAANGNSVDYPVRWTAPSTDMGAVTFWAAGNAINDNFSASCPTQPSCAPGCCDIIYLTSKSANFVAVPAVSTWGMVILAISVLTAGSIMAVRRRPARVLVPATRGRN